VSAISFIFMTLAPWASCLALGSLDVAHQPDKYVPKDDLARAALIYRDIAIAMMQP
jgi:acetylornithine deacetylase/succinyl-diaminopimelate desuccinylase-like protein